MRFFHTLTGSFYSAPLYAQARREASFGLGYSLLLVLLVTGITLTAGTVLLHRIAFTPHDNQPPMFDDLIQQIADQLPVMTLNNNQLQTKEPGAHVIHLRVAAQGKTVEGDVFTIDTSGATTATSMKTPVLITATDVAIHDSKETKIKPLSEYTKTVKGPIVINQALAQDMAKRVVAFTHRNLGTFYVVFGVITWAFYALFVYILRIFMLLILGLGGLLAGAALSVTLDYAAAVTLAAISYTPVVLLELVMFLSTGRGVGTLGSFALGMVTLTAAIYTLRDEPLAAAE